jgi:putative transposase
MFERRFRRTPGGVRSLGLHLVWGAKYSRRVLGGRVAARCGLLLEQVATEHAWQIVARVLWSLSYLGASVGYVFESTVRRYIEHQWDVVAS